MSAISSALTGLLASEASFNKAAGTIAASADPESDSVSLSFAIAGMMAARTASATDVQLIQTADEMQKSTISMLG